MNNRKDWIKLHFVKTLLREWMQHKQQVTTRTKACKFSSKNFSFLKIMLLKSSTWWKNDQFSEVIFYHRPQSFPYLRTLFAFRKKQNIEQRNEKKKKNSQLSLGKLENKHEKNRGQESISYFTYFFLFKFVIVKSKWKTRWIFYFIRNWIRKRNVWWSKQQKQQHKNSFSFFLLLSNIKYKKSLKNRKVVWMLFLTVTWDSAFFAY